MASAQEDLIVGEHFCIGDRIGFGSFGDVFEGKCLLSGDYVAIKVEPTNAKYSLLMHESRIYKTLNGGASEGIPRLHWCGTQGAYRLMVTEMLGPSLENLLVACHGSLSLSTTLQLADQMLARIEYIHSLGILHRDIKPENMLMGTGRNAHRLYFIDFGLAKRFRNPKTGEHNPIQTGRQLVGTARYASVNSHLGFEQGRRDDLESIGYLLVYLLRGRLPWQGLSIVDGDANYSVIGEKKLDIPLEELCEGLPEEFAEYLYTTRMLGYADEPDYAALRRLFRAARARLGGPAGPQPWDWAGPAEEGLSSEGEEEEEEDAEP
eukprot:EG_transcript_7802